MAVKHLLISLDGGYQPRRLLADKLPAMQRRPMPQAQQAETPPAPVAVRPVESPAPVIVEPPKAPELCGGRMPKSGMLVYFWIAGSDNILRPAPAWLLEHSPMSGKWSLNVQRIGKIYGQRDISFSLEPANCSWTWMPDAPRKVVAAPAQPPAEVPAPAPAAETTQGETATAPATEIGTAPSAEGSALPALIGVDEVHGSVLEAQTPAESAQQPEAVDDGLPISFGGPDAPPPTRKPMGYGPRKHYGGPANVGLQSRPSE